MKKIFKHVCLPLFHVNNNVYSFLGGIAISLATNLFSTICIDSISFTNQWNLYVSSFSFVIVSALLLYIASKLAGFQGFVNSPDIREDDDLKEDTILDATKDEYKKWAITYLLCAFFLLMGIAFLATDFSWIIRCSVFINNNGGNNL